MNTRSSEDKMVNISYQLYVNDIIHQRHGILLILIALFIYSVTIKQKKHKNSILSEQFQNQMLKL